MELVADLLAAAGFNVLKAANAEAAMRLARTAAPDLVLMDISLPGMDGLAATEVLKKDPTTRHLPIIALTAHAMMGDEEKALAAGCECYLTKPIDTRSLSATIASLLAKRQNNLQHQQADAA
jgi:two-component system, cell cycle response regulator DivK